MLKHIIIYYTVLDACTKNQRSSFKTTSLIFNGMNGKKVYNFHTLPNIKTSTDISIA